MTQLFAIPDEWIKAIAAFGAFVVVIYNLHQTYGMFDRVLGMAEKFADKIARQDEKEDQ